VNVGPAYLDCLHRVDLARLTFSKAAIRNEQFSHESDGRLGRWRDEHDRRGKVRYLSEADVRMSVWQRWPMAATGRQHQFDERATV